jgi:hypothetical protein
MKKNKIMALISLLLVFSFISISTSAAENSVLDYFNFDTAPYGVIQSAEKDIVNAAAIIEQDLEGNDVSSDFSRLKQNIVLAVQCKPLNGTKILSANVSSAKISDILAPRSSSTWHVFAKQNGVFTLDLMYSNYQSDSYHLEGFSARGASFYDALIRVATFLGNNTSTTISKPFLLDTHVLLFLVFEIDGKEYVTYADSMDDPTAFSKQWIEAYGYDPYDVVPISTLINTLQIQYKNVK